MGSGRMRDASSLKKSPASERVSPYRGLANNNPRAATTSLGRACAKLETLAFRPPIRAESYFLLLAGLDTRIL